jgi:2-oxoisovalerate dehydrogenase E1 component alpha subunit
LSASALESKNSDVSNTRSSVNFNKFTSDLKFIQQAQESLSSYRVMDHTGTVLKKDHDPNLPKDEVVSCYKKMLLLHTMDGILYDAQRQGRISFYMTHYGEEAMIGSASALTPDHVIFGQVL